MPEWTVCPQCQLKHTRRADGLCPRCHTSVGEASASPDPAPAVVPRPASRPAAPRPATRSASGAPAPMPDVYDGRPLGGSTLFAEPGPARSGISLGARIGGAVLVANGLALLIESGLNVTHGTGGGGPQSFRSPVSMLIDLVLGGMLFTGNPKGLPWAKFRVVAGGIILPAVFLAQGEQLLAGLQLAFSVGMALLLFGDASRPRLAAGLLATGTGLALETVGLFAMATGTAPLARMQLAPTLERDPVEVVEGLVCPYHVTAGGGRWYLRKAEAVKKENPLADLWLVWPEKDAHVLVIAERIEPGIRVDMDKFADVVLGNARRSARDLRVLARDALHAGGTRLHTQGTIKGMAIESYYGLFAAEPWIFQVVAFTSQRQFAAVEGDLASILASFEAPRL